MKRIQLIYVYFIVLTGCAGHPLHEHNHDGYSSSGTHEMHHQKIDVSGFKKIPKIDVQVTADAKDGWNIEVITENFQFAPETVNGDSVQGEGHAHLYLDGKKIARLYGPWYHLTGVPVGQHLIRVTLNDNNHSELAIGDETIAAEIEIHHH